MSIVLTFSFGVIYATAAFIVIRFPFKRVIGSSPTALPVFAAILFTSGLDVGLIMFPLTEFPTYEAHAAYAFTNPLAIEFGFWAFLVWGLYFLTTFYFCVVEPRLRLFEIPAIKFINNGVIIATCAFSGFLFLSYLPDYIAGITPTAKYALVAVVVLLAAISSTDIRFVKWLSLASTTLFILLGFYLWWAAGISPPAFIESASNLGGYFTNIHKFVAPISDYHAFYLSWWLAWSIMIGQFVSRFVGGISTWALLVALLVLPSIPIAFWFSILYAIHTGGVEIAGTMRTAMVAVGIIFVINSLDSLIRLYSDNLNLTRERFGAPVYIAGHWALLFALILSYQFTPMKIEWVALVVIGIYFAIFGLTLRRREALTPETANG
ncbi:MAG: BCCT family transporter [Marinicaulis sp.]|nr:BCCT family transporter [Marinicaulis sp.]